MVLRTGLVLSGGVGSFYQQVEQPATQPGWNSSLLCEVLPASPGFSNTLVLPCRDFKPDCSSSELIHPSTTHQVLCCLFGLKARQCPHLSVFIYPLYFSF